MGWFSLAIVCIPWWVLCGVYRFINLIFISGMVLFCLGT